MTDDHIERALASLEQARPASWRDVRALARRRRRVRIGLAAGVVAVAAATTAVVVPQWVGGNEPGDTRHVGAAVQLVGNATPLSSVPAAAVSAVANAEQDFTTALLHAVSGNGKQNISVSPASLGIALAMLRNGAHGATADEIASALRTAGIGGTTQNAGWAGLTAQWRAAAKDADIDLSSANSLWQQKGLTVRAAFLDALARYYDSGVWQVDFADRMPQALEAINNWTSQHTNGKIAKLFDALDPATLLVLANAVYFRAQWQTQFVPSDSEPGAFHTADGSTSSATFMTSPNSVAATKTDDYAAAQLPYQGGRFAALVVMPTHGALPNFVAGLTGSRLRSITSALSSHLQVKLPRFTTTSTIDLMPVLRTLGVRTALTPQADFSAMSSTAMQVGQAIQRVYLKVGEKGTEAAAATGIGMVPASIGPLFTGITFDHPFLFLIRDTQTGAVLFAAQIYRPT